jgi:adenylate cyclase
VRKDDLRRRVESLSDAEFGDLLDEVTCEAERFLQRTAMANDTAFLGMLDQALFACTYKIGLLCGAERSSLFLVDRERGELWLRVAQEEGADVRIPIGSGIAGRVAESRKALRVDDAYSHPDFNPEVDRATGFVTRSILCLPLFDRQGELFAVAQLLNRRDGQAFDSNDEERFAKFASAMGLILQSWWQMARGSGGVEVSA